MRDEQRHIPLTIRCDLLPPLKRAKGGLASHAKRVKEAGLSDRITIELRDYRDISGQFDRIALRQASRHGPHRQALGRQR